MTALALRKELHTITDIMPDKNLPAVKPLLAYLVDDYWKPITEQASPEEAAMIDERAKEFPKNFVSFKKNVLRYKYLFILLNQLLQHTLRRCHPS